MVRTIRAIVLSAVLFVACFLVTCTSLATAEPMMCSCERCCCAKWNDQTQMWENIGGCYNDFTGTCDFMGWDHPCTYQGCSNPGGVVCRIPPAP